MSSVTRKRGSGNDSPSELENGVKTRKEGEQLLRDTESFDRINDVTCELGQLNDDTFRQNLERPDKTDTLVRVNHGQDVAPAAEQWLTDMKGGAELRYLLDEYCARAGRAKIEEQLKQMIMDDRLARKQTNHRGNSNIVLENVDIPLQHEPIPQETLHFHNFEQSAETGEREEHLVDLNPDTHNLLAGGDRFLSVSAVTDEPSQNVIPVSIATKAVNTRVLGRASRGPGMYSSDEDEQPSSDEESSCQSDIADNSERHEPFQQELHPSQAIAQTAATVAEEEHAFDLPLDAQNIQTCDGVLSSSVVMDGPPEFSNHMKNTAHINFNRVELLNKFRPFRVDWGSMRGIEEMCGIIEERTTLIKNAQYEYSLADHQMFNQKLRSCDISTNRILSNGDRVGIPARTLLFKNWSTNYLKLWYVVLMKKNSTWFMHSFGRYLTHIDLLKYIANNSLRSSERAAAEHALRARKLRLEQLTIELKYLTLTLNKSDLGDNTTGICDRSYSVFQFEPECGRGHPVHLLEIITQFYDVSLASVILRNSEFDRGMNYKILQSEFGEPPKKQRSKIRIQKLIMEASGWADILCWFCPKIVVIGCEPSLSSNYDVIECKKIDADREIENSKAGSTLLRSNVTWSDRSIYSILTAHRQSGNRGRPRKIKYHCRSGTKTIKDWKQLFESWTRNFEAEHGNVGRKVTMHAKGIESVTLTLH